MSEESTSKKEPDSESTTESTTSSEPPEPKVIFKPDWSERVFGDDVQTKSDESDND